MGLTRIATIESVLAAICVAGFILGFILILIGRRGRRVDNHPLCRRCGYDLIGRPETSTRCAECGADLERRRAVRVGNRVPRRPLFWSGISVTFIFVLLSAGLGWLWFSRVNLMPYKPAWVLRGDASSSVAARRIPAVAELTRRLTAGELTDVQIQSVISDALAFQVNPNFPWTEWGPLTNKLLMAQKIRDDDWTKFVRQAVRLRLITRPRVRAGDPMPVGLAFDTDRLPRRERSMPVVMIGSGPPAPPAVIEFQWLNAEFSGLKVAKIPSRLDRYPGSFTPRYVEGAILDGSLTARLTEGVYPLSGRVRITVLNEKSQAKIASFDQDVHENVTIVPATTDPKQLFFVSDPALKEGVENAIWRVRVTALARGSMTDMYVLQFDESNLPAGLAHQAYLRGKDGREFAMGSITMGGRGGGGQNRYARAEIGQVGSIDVILRPDIELIKYTTRSDPIWGEEIIFRDVQIAPAGTPIQSGGAPPASQRAPASQRGR